MQTPKKGSLAVTNFIEILKDTAASNFTGMLRLENGTTIKVVYLQNGKIAFASSNERSDRLTEVLKNAGKLTAEQVEDAQARLRPNVSLGKTLVELGYISARDLLWGARAQVEQILHQLLFWKQGNFQILEGALPKEIIMLDIPVPQVIFTGVMKTRDRQWILDHIGSPEAVYELAANFHEKNQTYKLPAGDVAAKLNGIRPLNEVANLAGKDAFEVCKTVVAYEILDLAKRISKQPLQMPLVVPEEDLPLPGEPETLAVESPLEPIEKIPEQPQEEAVTTPAEYAGEHSTEEPLEINEEQNPEPAHSNVSLGQVLQLPTVEELQRETETQQKTDSGEISNNIEAGPVETNEPEPEPIVEPPVVEMEEHPKQAAPPIFGSFPHPPAPGERPAARSRLFVYLITGALLIAFVLAFQYFWNSRAQTNSETKPSNTQPKKPVSDGKKSTGQETPKQTEPPPPSVTATGPARLVLDGKIAEAASEWRQTLMQKRRLYTIQLVIACQDSTVTDIFKLFYDPAELAVVPLRYHEKNCYRVLHGLYSSFSEAQEARTRLPGTFLHQASPAAVVPVSRVVK